jgi:hypothetical protein
MRGETRVKVRVEPVLLFLLGIIAILPRYTWTRVIISSRLILTGTALQMILDQREKTKAFGWYEKWLARLRVRRYDSDVY